MFQQPLPATPSRLSAVFAWLRRRCDGSELASTDSSEARRIAADLRVSVDDLIRMAGQSDDDAALMGRMMALHGIDRLELEGSLPEVVRQLAVTCSRCDRKGRCKGLLDNGGSVADAATFCLNAESMQAFARR